MPDFKAIVDLYKEGIKPADIVEMLKIKKQLENEEPDKKDEPKPEPDKKDEPKPEPDKKEEPEKKKDNLPDKDQVDYKKLYEESQAEVEKLQKTLRTRGGGSDSDNKDGMKSLIDKMRSFH